MSEATPSMDSEAVAEPDAVVEPEGAAEPEAEPASEAEPEAEPEAAAEPAVVAQAEVNAEEESSVGLEAEGEGDIAPAGEAGEDTVFDGTEEEVAAAQKIQSMQRGKDARKGIADQKAAAVKIQSIQRGKKTRASAALIGNAETDDLIKLMFTAIGPDADGLCTSEQVGSSAFGHILSKETWSCAKFAALVGGTPAVEPADATEPEAEAEAAAESEAEPEAESEAEPEAEAASEPAQPGDEPEAEPESEPEAEVAAKAETETGTEPEAKVEPGIAEAASEPLPKGKIDLAVWAAFFAGLELDAASLKKNVVALAFNAELDVSSLVGEMPSTKASAPVPVAEEEIPVSTTLPAIVQDAIVEWNDGKDDFVYVNDKVKAARMQLEQDGLENSKDLLPTSLELMYHSFGFEGRKRSNLLLLGQNTILTAAGNTVVLIDVQTLQRTYINGFAGRGIGALAVSPDGNYFAVGEKGSFPDILIYEYPSLKIKRIMKRGAERGYSSLAFNKDGDRLASVGMAPDYLLTIWQWRTESIVLKNKAFSQDIFKAEFSPYQRGEIVTSGVGHIRFWKMASTFTGMKLQGAIGKFGKVELSDVAAFCEFPDGLKLCGTENGQLLVWDGEFVKCQLSQTDGAPCHEGNIEVCYSDGEDIVTAGADGYIKMWDMKTLNEADLADDATEFYVVVAPTRVIHVGDDVNIMSMVKREKDWLVQDANGCVWKVSQDDSYSPIRLLSFHSGTVAGVIASTTEPVFVTAGEDKSVRLYDYEHRRELHHKTFSAAATKLQQIPVSLDSSKGGAVAVGFEDGVVRFLGVTRDEFKLLSVCKPHAGAVLSIEVSPDGKQIATAGADGNVFFFKAQKGEGNTAFTLTPVGFYTPTESAAQVNFLSWDQNSRKILISCQDGSVVEAISPGAGDNVDTVYDTSKSFEIALKTKKYTFQRPKPPADEAEPEAEPEAEEGGEIDEALLDPAQATEEEINLPPEPALTAMYFGELGNFLLTMDGIDKGHVYECSFDIEFPLTDLTTADDAITSMSYSLSKEYILSGYENGVVEVRGSDLEGQVWRSQMHDGFYGAVKGMATSFDGRFLITAGADDNVFVVDMSFAELDRAKIQQMKMLAEDLTPAPPVPPKDITESGAYSIQEEKLKAEHDAQVAAAEAQKDNVRAYLETLRQEFNALKAHNAELAPNAQLAEEEFDLDPELGAVLAAEREEKLSSADAEMAWDRERTQKHLSKLNTRYTDMMIQDGIELIGFRNGHAIKSFKVTKLPAAISDELGATIEENDAVDVVDGAQENTAVPDATTVAADDAEAATGEADSGADKGKHEMRKENRLKRKAAMAALMAQKIGDNYQNPDDVAAIIWAKENMGDFKLKQDPNYVVPEAQRVNAEKKRREMVLLETSVHKIKMGFNERFLALRDLKKRIIKSVHDDSMTINSIEAELVGIEFEGELPKLELDYAEFPEESPAASVEDEAAIDATSAEQGSEEDEDEDDPIPDIEESELEKLETIARHKLLIYERSSIIQRVEQSIVAFDVALDELRRESFTLSADLKTTEMKFLLLYQELKLLKDFEKREHVLTAKLTTKQGDRNGALQSIDECQAKLEENRVKVEALLKVDAQIMREFTEALGDNNPFYEQLFKTFKRKIKRVKPKETSGSGDEDDESESESDDDFDSDSDDEEEEEDACPQGCSQDLFDQVCALRERRLDQEELSAEYQKTIGLLKKENDTHVKREASINTALAAIEEEIQAFQSEKQSKLNELDMVVMLKMHQIQYMNSEQTGLPPATADEEGAPSLQTALVMTTQQLEKLAARIVELADEKKGLKRRQKEIFKDNKRVSKHIGELQGEIQKLAAKSREVQMLKFGQEVDLDALSKRSVNKTGEVLEAKCRKIELRQMREMSEAQAKIRAAQFELSDMTKENTMRLARLADLTADQHRLEMSLNATQGQLSGGENSAGAGMDEEEKQRLVQLVRLQEREINALKAEINLLRMKGGHVYTPAN